MGIDRPGASKDGKRTARLLTLENWTDAGRPQRGTVLVSWLGQEMLLQVHRELGSEKWPAMGGSWAGQAEGWGPETRINVLSLGG